MRCRLCRLGAGFALLLALLALPALAQPDDLMRRAQAEFDLGRGPEAIALWQQALVEWRRLGRADGQLQSLARMGEAAGLTGRWRDASDWLAQAMDLARTQGRHDAVRRLLPYLAEAADRAGDHPRSADANRALARQAEAAGDGDTAAIALARLGQALLGADRPSDEAEPALRRAAELFTRQQKMDNAAAALTMAGDALRRREQYLPALATYREAARLAQDARQPAWQARALQGQGNTLTNLGDGPGALQAHRDALRSARRAGDRQREADILLSLGNTHYFLRQPDDAARSYEQAMDLARQNGLRTLESLAAGNLGLALSHLGQHDRAETLLRQDVAASRERGDRMAEARAQGNLATLLMDRQRHDQALAPLQRSRELAQALGYRRGEAIALRNLGFAQLKSGQPREAETSLRAAVALQDSLRDSAREDDRLNVSLADSQRDAHRNLQAALVAQGKHAEALLASETGRAQALADLLNRRAGTARTAPSNPTLASLLALAKSRRLTVVEWSFVPADEAIYAWVLQPDGQLHFVRNGFKVQGAAGIDGAVDGLVRETRAALGALGAREKPEPKPGVADARELLDLWYRILVKPLEPWLPADPDAPVLLVPQGSLFLLPLAALRDAAGRAWAERNTLFTAPSLHTLGRLRPAGPASGGALVVGNPQLGALPLPGGGQAQFQPLPAAEREARTVAQMLGTQPLLGAAATRDAVRQRAASASVIHLATHGVADDVRGLGAPGALALAAGPDGDGWLATPDVADLKLQADLVVLSACHTGLGQVSGDGVLGLARAFLAAGARSLLVSLWAVPDQPTAQLMQDFHRRVAAGSPKAQALRQAMLAQRQHTPDPLAWAGFIVVGDL